MLKIRQNFLKVSKPFLELERKKKLSHQCEKQEDTERVEDEDNQ